METKHGIKYRQLHIEDYLRERPAEQGKVTGVYAQEWITGNTGTNTELWTDNLLDIILRSDNLNAAYKKVKANKGTGGIDGMQVDELLPYLIEHRDELVRQLREGKYKPNPVRRVEIPKEEKGNVRKLGIPTVVDRLIQQAIAQELTPIYEEQFSENSYGFRPGRSAHDALAKCRTYVDEGYEYAVSMDLQSYFDTVNHSKLIEVLSRTIKDGRVVSLIHKYLNAGVMEDGGFHATPEGVPQGGPLSPLCGNVMLNELDKELERVYHRETIPESQSPKNDNKPHQQGEISRIRLLPPQREMPYAGTPQVNQKDEETSQRTDSEGKQVEQSGKRRETQAIYDGVDKLLPVCRHENTDGNHG